MTIQPDKRVSSHPTAEEIEKTLARDKRSRLPFMIISFVVIASLIGGVVWWQWPTPTQIHWTTRPLDRGDIIVSASATGTLQPRRTLTIGAEISGKILTVEVENNERIDEGQVLATFDTSVLESSLALSRASLSSSQASLRRAEASLAEAIADEGRTRALVDRGVAPQAELETAEARTIRARADRDQARADIERSRASLADVQTQLDRAVITSPIDGVILARKVEPGMTVAASLQAPELFVAAEDLSRMRLDVWVDEADVGLVKPGQKATFQVSAWPGRSFEATVETLDLSPTMTDNVVTYIATLSVENPDGLLRPGMSAATTIVTGSQTDVLRVPNAALRFQPPELGQSSGSSLVPQMGRGFGGRPSARSGPQGIGTVHVLRDGLPTPIRIQTGRTDGQYTAITTDELRPGDRVVVGFTEGPPSAEELERQDRRFGGERPAEENTARENTQRPGGGS